MYQAFGYAEQALKQGNDVNFACHKARNFFNANL